MEDAYIRDLLRQRIHKWLQECSSNCKYTAEKYVYPAKVKRNPVDLVHRRRNTFSSTIMPYCVRFIQPVGVLIYTMQNIFEVSEVTQCINQNRSLPGTKNRERRKILTGNMQNRVSVRGRVNSNQHCSCVNAPSCRGCRHYSV